MYPLYIILKVTGGQNHSYGGADQGGAPPLISCAPPQSTPAPPVPPNSIQFRLLTVFPCLFIPRDFEKHHFLKCL